MGHAIYQVINIVIYQLLLFIIIINKIVGNFVYLVYLLLYVCSHTTSGVVKTRKSKLVCLRTISLKNILLGLPCIEMIHGS